jgi:hypothetical protein
MSREIQLLEERCGSFCSPSFVTQAIPSEPWKVVLSYDVAMREGRLRKHSVEPKRGAFIA